MPISLLHVCDAVGTPMPTAFPAKLPCRCGNKAVVYDLGGHYWVVCGTFRGLLHEWCVHAGIQVSEGPTSDTKIVAERQAAAMALWQQATAMLESKTAPVPTSVAEYYHRTILQYSLFEAVVRHKLMGLLVPRTYHVGDLRLTIRSPAFLIPHWACPDYIAAFTVYEDRPRTVVVDSRVCGLSNAKTGRKPISFLTSSPMGSVYFTAASVAKGYEYVFCSPPIDTVVKAPAAGYNKLDRAVIHYWSDPSWQTALDGRLPTVVVSKDAKPSEIIQACSNPCDPVDCVVETLKRCPRSERAEKWRAIPMTEVTRSQLAGMLPISIHGQLESLEYVSAVSIPGLITVYSSAAEWSLPDGRPVSDFTVKASEVITYPSGDTMIRMRYRYGFTEGEVVVPHTVSPKQLYDSLSDQIIRKTGQRPWISPKIRKYLVHLALRFGNAKRKVIDKIGVTSNSIFLPGATWTYESGWQPNDYTPTVSGVHIQRIPDPRRLLRIPDPPQMSEEERAVMQWLVDSTVSAYRYGWSYHLAVPDAETAEEIASMFLLPKTSRRAKIGDVAEAMQYIDWPVVVTTEKIPSQALWPNVGYGYRMVAVVKEKLGSAIGWHRVGAFRCRTQPATGRYLASVLRRIDEALRSLGHDGLDVDPV